MLMLTSDVAVSLVSVHAYPTKEVYAFFSILPVFRDLFHFQSFLLLVFPFRSH